MYLREDASLRRSTAFVFLGLGLMVDTFMYMLFLSLDNAGGKIPNSRYFSPKESHTVRGIKDDDLAVPIGDEQSNGPQSD